MSDSVDSFKIVLPIIHMNGSNRESLQMALDEVYGKLGDALDAMKEIAPNGRDYYPDPGRLALAIDQHQSRLKVITHLRNELEREIYLLDSSLED